MRDPEALAKLLRGMREDSVRIIACVKIGNEWSKKTPQNEHIWVLSVPGVFFFAA